MPSPFPGMDPFIEGQDWEDFHQGLIGELSAALVPRVRPRYVVRKERRIYVEHKWNGPDRVVRSDIAVLQNEQEQESSGSSHSPATSTVPVVVGLPMPQEQREAFLTVRERESMEVVTVIEVLSPGNKRAGSDGRDAYLQKRESILNSETHLVELDLLRGGQPLPTTEPLPPGDFFALVCRRQRRYKAEVYAWHLQDPLPKIPIPLAADDPSVEIDLQEIFTTMYDRAGYDYSLDYERQLEPAINQADTFWVETVLKR